MLVFYINREMKMRLTDFGFSTAGHWSGAGDTP